MKSLPPFICWLLAFSCADASSQADNSSLEQTVAMHEATASAELLDRQAFIVEAPVSKVLLSPDGDYVAWLGRENHQTALHLLQIASGRQLRLFSSAGLNTIYWTSDSSHLILDLRTSVGVVDLAKPGMPAYITMLDSTRDERFFGSADSVLDHVLIGSRYDDGSYGLRQVSITGDSRKVLQQEALIVSAIAADEGDSVIVESATATGHQFTLVSAEEQTPMFSCTLLETCRMLAYEQAPKRLWLASNSGSNLINLMAYTFDDDKLVLEHSHDQAIVDVAAVVFANKRPLAVQYRDGLLRNYGLDPATEALLQTAQAQLQDSEFTPQVSDDGNTWLITESSSILQHPRYYVFATATGTLAEILQEERAGASPIPAEKLSHHIPLQYPAQDGSTLHGYVSLPKGKPLNTSPMVTLVHGGPVGRIDAVYNEFTQLLVNRGYIVFEPNFRASTGYGRTYVEQAAREFGNGLVQQDIIDGVHYLTAEGIGDPQQLAIAGHSFGGAAVLTALTFTPELFKAGFASAAPADMATIMQFQRTPERIKDMDPSVLAMSDLLFGAVDDAAAMQAMRDRSPQAHLADINSPLFLIAGGDDMNVPISHVKEYALTLLNQQKTLSLFLDEDEAHGVGLSSTRSRLAYFWMAEEFFGIYLGGNKQPLDDPALASYIRQNMLINTNPEFSVPTN